MKRRATLIGSDSSEIWLDKAIVTIKAKPYTNGRMTLFISLTRIEIADGFADQKTCDKGIIYVVFPRRVIVF